jgi:hypothetical protein
VTLATLRLEPITSFASQSSLMAESIYWWEGVVVVRGQVLLICVELVAVDDSVRIVAEFGSHAAARTYYCSAAR